MSTNHVVTTDYQREEQRRARNRARFWWARDRADEAARLFWCRYEDEVIQRHFPESMAGDGMYANKSAIGFAKRSLGRTLRRGGMA